MNLQENILSHIKRRIHLIDKVIDNLLPNMYPCDYNSSDHFVEGVLDEIIWFLPDFKELQGIEREVIENYILDYKYDELTEYFNQRCIVLKNDNIQETIRRILREESNLSFRRRVKFGEIDKSVKRRMVSNFRKDENIEISIVSTVAEVVGDVMPIGFKDDDVLYHKIWHELTSFIRKKYGDDLRQYFEKRQNEVDQENNEMGYEYIFVKHDKPYHQQWSGFAKAFNSFDDMITKYGHWIDVDWDEVKQKLDTIKDFPESTFTGRHNSRPLRISNAGDEGNTWGYNFSVIKSIPEENIGKQEQNEGEITERCWKGYTKKGMKTMFGKRYPNCVKKTN